MRGLASGITQTPQPGTVASGPTGPSTFGWVSDGSYGDWYGGHEHGHTVGRFHAGVLWGGSARYIESVDRVRPAQQDAMRATSVAPGSWVKAGRPIAHRIRTSRMRVGAGCVNAFVRTGSPASDGREVPVVRLTGPIRSHS